MSDLDIRFAGRAGRISLTRPAALNALTHDMCRRIDAALAAWAADDAVSLVIIDAAGDKAFCAGGDIAAIHASGSQGDLEAGRRFWRDEYRMNARLFRYPKPVASFLQGFAMGGGIGLGCHGSHRVVGDTSRLALPECGIGLIPDVGSSLILARAPGRLGEYLALTGARMVASNAIFAGFADHYLSENAWPAVIADLERTGEAATIAAAATTPPPAPLAGRLAEIDQLFAAADLDTLSDALAAANGPVAAEGAKALARISPLSAACALAVIEAVRRSPTIDAALEMEYRFAHRAVEQGDVLEGIRAAIIDRDHAPVWRTVAPGAVEAMLRPVPGAPLDLGGSS